MDEANQFVRDMHNWHGQILGFKTVDALRKNHFDAQFFESGITAIEEVMKYIHPGMTVAFGGSQTVKQLGLIQRIEAAGAIILDHNAKELDEISKLEIMRKQQVCDLFLCSSNAITYKGELYNIDGNGNRVSAMVFGPRKVIVLAGTNKLCSDELQAWDRIRTIAAPVNYKRLNRPNPCTREGICMDCNLPTRGCNAYLVLRKKPALSDISIFIINETLGF
jgi:hypothetical protein